MQKIDCAICGKNQNLQELYPATFDLKKVNSQTFSARRTPDRMHYRFVKCLNCGLIFSNPILPEEKIAKLYQQSDFFYKTEARYLRKTYGTVLKQAIKNKKNINLLDIGCGDGFFLREAQSMGIAQVYGVEPGIDSVKKAFKPLQRKIKVAMFGPGLYKSKSFDVVCCFHTLDHIVDPNAFLQECFHILKPKGKAVFVVHDTQGLSVKLFGEGSAIFDIEHIYLFNKSTLQQIFAQHGFKNIQVINIKNRYPLHYWWRMIPIPPFLKKLGLKIMELTKLGEIPIAIKAGNIAVIAQKP